MCLGTNCNDKWISYKFDECSTLSTLSIQLDTSGIIPNRTPSFPTFSESCSYDTAFSYSPTLCPVTYFKVTTTDPNGLRYVIEVKDMVGDGSWSMAEVTSES